MNIQNRNLGIIVAVIVIGFVAVIYFTGNAQNLYNYFNYNNPFTPLNPPNINTQYQVTLGITPNPTCVFQGTTGTITSNIANGRCSIFVDPGTGWQLFTTT